MIGIPITTRRMRTIRQQVWLPRAFGLIVAAVMSAAGLRATFAPPRPEIIERTAAAQGIDQGAEAFAEAFTRVYLSWNTGAPQVREAQLAPFLSSALDPAAGVQANGTESVSWTSVVGEQRSGNDWLVTVAAQTSSGLIYLCVPVMRDRRGFLAVTAYPAFVGPPATDPNAAVAPLQPVDDQALQTVVARAVSNYLAGNQADLSADLTPTALVSMPAQHLTVTTTEPATWLVPSHRVELEVTATDAQGSSLTLSYEVGVEKLERWFVQSIQVNPIFDGGS
jgi:hypothetical protein